MTKHNFPKLGEECKDSGIIQTILSTRYFTPREKTWDDLIDRVSSALSYTPTQQREFYDLMKEKKFIPNTPTLMNAGTDNPMMSACFVLPIDDDLGSIMKTLTDAAFIFKSGGGVGINYSNLRPKGTLISNTNGQASGPVSFMEMFNTMSETIKQGGKRRGAQMSILDFTHPDIYHFITVKNEEGRLNNMNLSVMFTDEDIQTIVEKPHTMHKCGKTYGELFDLIAKGIWEKGEPGVLFYDRINRDVKGYKINATNPCGEMVLPAYGSCCLGSFDISKYINPDYKHDLNIKYMIDTKQLITDVKIASHMLSNINALNKYPLPEIEEVSRHTHPRIGLGIMGYADLLLKLDIPYGSEPAQDILEEILFQIKHTAQKTIPNLESYLSIAPTGTISIFANSSSGIEPVFSWVYMRRNTVDNEFLIVHPIFDAKLKEMIITNKVLTEEQKEFLYQEILNEAYTKGSISECEYLPDHFKRVFKCAMDITPDEHLLTQASAQNIVDASISKTINLPNKITTDDIKETLLSAWVRGVKGLTMYRDGSRSEVVLDLNRNTESQGDNTSNESSKGNKMDIRHEVKDQTNDKGMLCPDCGAKIERSEGCIKCNKCGWNKCN